MPRKCKCLDLAGSSRAKTYETALSLLREATECLRLHNAKECTPFGDKTADLIKRIEKELK